MSLRILPDLVQGTDEWAAQRRGMVTASIMGRLVTPTLKVAANDTSRDLLRLLVAERITGWTDPVYVSDDMLRGTLDEPVARDLYAQDRGVPVVEVGFMVYSPDEPDDDSQTFEIGYSPDGLVDDDGLIEIKSRRAKAQLRTILDDEVPAENMAQIQTGLLVSGRAWCDYVSYCAGMPLYVKRVLPDPAWRDAILAAVTAFEDTAFAMTTTYRERVQGMPETERGLYQEMI